MDELLSNELMYTISISHAGLPKKRPDTRTIKFLQILVCGRDRTAAVAVAAGVRI